MFFENVADFIMVDNDELNLLKCVAASLTFSQSTVLPTLVQYASQLYSLLRLSQRQPSLHFHQQADDIRELYRSTRGPYPLQLPRHVP